MSTFNYNKVNLAAAQIPASITDSQTSITVDASESALFPTVPFFATIMPAGGVPNTLNSEIVQVTAINTASGALTITRAQRGTTAKAQDEGAVIMNGVYIEDLAQSQAVGKSFFSATLSSSVYYIQDARLTTTPEDGDSIRVVFGSDWTSGTPKLSLNSGTAYNIYAGNNLTASHGKTTTPALVKTGVIYELTYYNAAWHILNLTANSSITSDNVDWATFDKIMVSGHGESAQNTGVIWLDNVKVKVGDRLTEFNGGVKIGAGVTMVSVSALAFFIGKLGYSWVAIFKNNERIQDIIANTNDTYNSGSLSDVLIPVSENDIITLRTLENGNILRRHQTYLTVEMVS